MSTHDSRAFASKTVHSGQSISSDVRSSAPVLDHAVSWSYASMAQLEEIFAGTRLGYNYGRHAMPTPALLEDALTVLEEGQGTVVFATGIAAIAAVLSTAGRGRRVLATPDLYGLTYALVHDWLPEQGAEVRFIPAEDAAAISQTLEQWRPQLLLTETMSNPLVKVSNLPWLIKQAHAVNCRVLVDNTFATPYLCRPATLGADYTVESLTKYINGHGDVLGGAVTVLQEEDLQALRIHRKRFGATLDPFAAWLTLRGLRTLALRLQRQSENALHLAQFLEQHPAVQRVYYPGLPSHPDHHLARQLFQERGFGGMLAFDLVEASREWAWRVMDRLQLALRAPTLGDYTTSVSYPAHASHRALSPVQRQALGIGEGCIRVSVGIEASDDIIADFSQALAGEAQPRSPASTPAPN